MSRQRRKRTSVSMQVEVTEYQASKQQSKSKKNDVVFMEEMDYKMEIDVKENAQEKKVVVLKKPQEFTEQQIREAFKKKLRKYSGKVRP